MKKLLLSILLVMSSISLVSAESGVRVGVSASVGLMEADGKEVENSETNTSQTEEGIFGTASIFVEKTLDFLPGPLGRLSLGLDYVPHKLSTGTSDNVRAAEQGDGTESSTKTNKVSADLEDITSIYLTANITDFLYVKAGYVEMDIITTEALDTGSSYGNTSTDGMILGIGFHHQSDGGVFYRVEANRLDLDGVSVTSTNADNTVTLNGIEGTNVRMSIGRSF
jgi:hypothetical protein|tara:strand:+ start:31 stop:702 length:672 start_codon:yes stop_codon:yes gene_type:complete